jgi:H+/Cl- antiporter ClcA
MFVLIRVVLIFFLFEQNSFTLLTTTTTTTTTTALAFPTTHRRRQQCAIFGHYSNSIPACHRRTIRLQLVSDTKVEDITNGSAETVSNNDNNNGTVNGKLPLPSNTQDGSSAIETSISSPKSENRIVREESYWCYWSTAYELTQAGTVGVLTGFLVAIFKLSIEAVRSLCYEQDILVPYPALIALVPALGGVIVGLLYVAGGGAFPPGLKGTAEQVMQEENENKSLMDSFKEQANFARKSSAAVATLGTGASLGPEGPCVEIGLNVAKACTSFNRPVPSREAGSNSGNFILSILDQGNDEQLDKNSGSNNQLQNGWNRVLLSAGAAAGVAAGFNAPIAGVFFALEIMQNTFLAIDEDAANSGNQMDSNVMKSFSSTTSITPILIAAVLSALVSQSLLGNHLVLTLSQFTLETPLVELPLYLLLGAMSGVVAFVFTYTAKLSKQFFNGDLGSDAVRGTMSSIPNAVKPAIGGLICGIVGIAYPQILFFGYETLNSLLRYGGLPLELVLTLLFAKIALTAISAGSGLVGGTFAPSLFLGAMLGAAFHEGAVYSLDTMMDVLSPEFSATFASTNLQIAGVPAYAMVGAASVLAALFRAPLTASLLLFEVTRNYDVILPLMASAGIGSIVGDILEDQFENRDKMSRRDKDPVSWGDLSDKVVAKLKSQLGMESNDDAAASASYDANSSKSE